MTTVGRVLADAVDFVREHPSVQRAAVEIITLLRTLVETRGVDEAKNLLQNMVDKPAAKMDISEAKTAASQASCSGGTISAGAKTSEWFGSY